MDESVPSTSAIQLNRKRRANNLVDKVTPAKRSTANNNGESFNLLNFSDEVLLEILKNCDSVTLYALSKTCKQFLKLIGDRRLWKSLDFSNKRMMGHKIKKLFSHVQIGDLEEFKVRGMTMKYPNKKWKNQTVTVKMLETLSSTCPNLKTMIIREGYINFREIKITDFPATLKRLIFHACQITVPQFSRLFWRIDERLEHLEEISLEKCPWFDTQYLVVFSKLPHLKRLILRGCKAMKSCVPYGSIATRFGFKCLEYLDLRDTPISDSDIQCFNATLTLREILMDCPFSLRLLASRSLSSLDDSDDDSTDDQHTKLKNRYAQNDDDDLSLRCDNSSDINSHSDDDSDCSTDSEDDKNDDDGDTSGPNTPHESSAYHNLNPTIQVVLHNGRMIKVNAGHSYDNDQLRCVIGIISARDQNEGSANHEKATTSNNQPESIESTSNSKPNETDATCKREKSFTMANRLDNDQAGPSGFQAHQNNNQIPKTNKMASNAKETAGPSQGIKISSTANPQRFIIIRQDDEHANNSNNPNNSNNANGGQLEVRDVNARHNLIDTPAAVPRYEDFMHGMGVSDRGICSFGIPRHNVQQGIIWIRAELRPPDTPLERITVRNYQCVTDVSLRHLVLCAPNLRYLDVTGTSVTRKGITTFLKSKPDCHVVSNHFNN